MLPIQVLYWSGDAIPCQLESPTRNPKKKWKQVGISSSSAKTSGKKTKQKNTNFKPAWKQSWLSNEFGISRDLILMKHLGALWQIVEPPYPTDATQHHGGNRQVVNPNCCHELGHWKSQMLVTNRSACFCCCCCFFWWCGTNPKFGCQKQNPPEVSPKPCFSQITFCWILNALNFMSHSWHVHNGRFWLLVQDFVLKWWDTAIPTLHFSNGKLCETSTMLWGGVFY